MNRIPVDPDALRAQLTRDEPLPDGHKHDVVPYNPVAGWYCVGVSDEHGMTYAGALHLYGPGGRVLRLSSNPGIHDFEHTAQVIAELADSDMTDAQLLDEIFRRTRR
jgi:hypothetical protein